MDGTDKSMMVRGNFWQTAREPRVILLIVLCGSALLLMANLGNIYLWQDEAQTALISKTILTSGVPRGYDGKNFFSQELGAEYGKNYIWRWHTWLPFYVLAAFYKVFGVSTFVSRLPFVLFGLATIAGTYHLARELWADSRVPLLAAGLLAISVPFLLLCRQCRYYSMTMFFTVLSLHFYVAVLNGRKYAALLLFVTSTLLFHSMQFYLPVLFETLLIYAVVFRRDKLKLLLFVIVAVVVINGPWMVWLSTVNYPTINKERIFNPTIAAGIIREYIIGIFHYVFSVWLLAIAAISLLVKHIRGRFLFQTNIKFWEKISLPVIFIIFNLLTISAIAPFSFFRYIAPSVPLLIILAAVVIDSALNDNWLFGITAVIIMIASGQIRDYLYEITHDYDGPSEGIANYLNQHGSHDDIVAMTNGEMPLKFYTKMRIISAYTGEDLTPIKNARWIIMRKYVISAIDLNMQKYIFDNVPRDECREIVIDYPDIPFENREGPGEHYFRTVRNADKVIIYERNK
jgi:4-amino-4-deoxy-L-arabinose transferase-like glycosyltransferase